MRRNVSIRFTDDEYALIDAVKEHLTVSRKIPHSRADVFRTALSRLKPPEAGTPAGSSPTAAAWRRAYHTVFRGEQP